MGLLIITGMKTQYSVDPKSVRKGSRAFRSHEKRDAVYKVSTFLVDHFWGKPQKMADGLGVLLLVWNNALYRYGLFDFSALEETLRKNMLSLKAFRNRNILSFSDADADTIKPLFNAFLEALQIADGKLKGRRSPVAVGKALHLLAPAFFPLWDNKVARGYGCHYSVNPSERYLRFMRISQGHVAKLRGKVQTGGSTLLKILDEYNYAKFTREWV